MWGFRHKAGLGNRPIIVEVGTQNGEGSVMVKVPKEDRFKFYQFLAASKCFEHVIDVCDSMQAKSIEPSHVLHYPLTLAIAIMYARPFKQRKQIRLPTIMIPKELINCLIMILT
jgi:hypothetical protein